MDVSQEWIHGRDIENKRVTKERAMGNVRQVSGLSLKYMCCVQWKASRLLRCFGRCESNHGKMIVNRLES